MSSPLNSLPETFVGRFFRWVNRVLFYQYWAVGVIDQPIENLLTWTETPPIRWLESFDRTSYRADPLAWPLSDDTFLCEELDFTDEIGRIVAMKCGTNGRLHKVPMRFPIDGHLSFPFLFMNEGHVYAMPESCAARRLEIFRWQPERGTWISHTTLLNDTPAADAVLFHKDGYYWVLYTDTGHNAHDNLHLLFAPSLTGPWTPHPANPVQLGRDRSRGAGPIVVVNGRLLRPTQDCSIHYGGALRIMEITTCTPERYEEKQVKYFKPNARAYPDGLHTICAWGDRCLVDGMRLVFLPRLIWRKIARRLGLI